jgi:hypothetical protein
MRDKLHPEVLKAIAESGNAIVLGIARPARGRAVLPKQTTFAASQKRKASSAAQADSAIVPFPDNVKPEPTLREVELVRQPGRYAACACARTLPPPPRAPSAGWPGC